VTRNLNPHSTISAEPRQARRGNRVSVVTRSTIFIHAQPEVVAARIRDLVRSVAQNADGGAGDAETLLKVLEAYVCARKTAAANLRARESTAARAGRTARHSVRNKAVSLMDRIEQQKGAGGADP
jgi:hypothetical protein